MQSSQGHENQPVLVPLPSTPLLILPVLSPCCRVLGWVLSAPWVPWPPPAPAAILQSC